MSEMNAKRKVSIHDDKIQRLVRAEVLAFGMVWALPWAFQVSDMQIEFTNSVFSLLLFVGFSYLFNIVLKYEFSGSKKKWIIPGIFGGLFSFCMVVGAQLEKYESIPFREMRMWGSILILGILSGILGRYFWDKLQNTIVENLENKEKEDVDFHIKSWLVKSIIIFLCYIPVFLAVYPGFFVYDAGHEYNEVATRIFSTHHPLAHVLLLGGVIHLVYKVTNSYNLGIACYTIIQMMFLSGVFGWCIEKLKTKGLKKKGQFIFAFYFGVCPVIVMYVLCSTKDGLFCGFLLLTLVMLQDFYADFETFMQNKKKMVWLIVSAVGMMLFRHNGFYAWIVMIPVVIFYMKKKKVRWTMYLLTIGIIYLLINKGLTNFLGASAYEKQEMLTVPIMQMARVYNYEEVPEDDKMILNQYLSDDALKRYRPKLSDPVKGAFNNVAFNEDKVTFFKLWLKWGIEHPFNYVNAWFMTSYGFWYPDTVIDVYRGNTVFTYTYEDSSYFGYEVEAPGHRESKIPWLDELYRKMSLEIFQQKVPVISMLFSPGFMFWAMMFLLGFFLYVGEIRRIMPFMLPLLVWLTVILGPTYLVRYVLFLWFAVPLLLWEVVSFLRENPKTN